MGNSEEDERVPERNEESKKDRMEEGRKEGTARLELTEATSLSIAFQQTAS